MKVDTKGHTTIIKDTEGNVTSFLEKVSAQHASYKGQNLILDMSHDKTTTIESINAFADLSKTHQKGKKSFVIVVENIDFNAVSNSVMVVPSVLEAHDIIEMEEIERDLGF
jgi:hypothetical protein